MLVNRQGFTCDGRLVDLKESVVGDDSTVSGDNSALIGVS